MILKNEKTVYVPSLVDAVKCDHNKCAVSEALRPGDEFPLGWGTVSVEGQKLGTHVLHVCPRCMAESFPRTK